VTGDSGFERGDILWENVEGVKTNTKGSVTDEPNLEKKEKAN